MKYIVLVSLFVLGGCATSSNCTSCKIKKPVEKVSCKKPCKSKDSCKIEKKGDCKKRKKKCSKTC